MTKGVGMSRGVSTHPPDMGPGGGRVQPPGHGIQWDTVGKREVRILLECFLVKRITLFCENIFSGPVGGLQIPGKLEQVS